MKANGSVRIERRKVVNTRDFDVCVRDAYGAEHILHPKAEKEVAVICEGKESKRDHGRK